MSNSFIMITGPFKILTINLFGRSSVLKAFKTFNLYQIIFDILCTEYQQGVLSSEQNASCRGNKDSTEGRFCRYGSSHFTTSRPSLPWQSPILPCSFVPTQLHPISGKIIPSPNSISFSVCVRTLKSI